MSAETKPPQSPSTAESNEVAHYNLVIPDYELLRRIGKGAFGEVWLARNVLGFFRAVKVVHRATFADTIDYERELTGVRNFEPISREHIGLVDLLDVGVNQAQGYFYYAMELADDAIGSHQLKVEGPHLTGSRAATLSPNSDFRFQSLDWRIYSPLTLSAYLRSDGRLPLVECFRVSLALTDALQFLHDQGLIHRDIKPSNIIFVGGVPKLADVGTVSRVDDAKTMVGTEGFRAPEGPGKPQADLYSLGKVLYEISTGKDRNRFPEPLTTLAELPDRSEWREFNAVVEKACEPDPTDRYATITQLRADLLTIQAGRSVRRQWLLQRRLKQTTSIAGGIVLLIALVLFIQSVRLREAERGRALLDLQQTIGWPHASGWSHQAWKKASNAAVRFNLDTNFQTEAAASLVGMDAVCQFQSNRIGGSSVAFSLDAKRVLYGSQPEIQKTDDSGKVHLLNVETKELIAFAAPGLGPVGFLSDGTPVQFSADATNRLALWTDDSLLPHLPYGRSSGLLRTEQNSVYAQTLSANSVSNGISERNKQTALRFFTLANGESFTELGALAASPDCTFVAASGVTASNRTCCAMWNGTTGKLLMIAAPDWYSISGLGQIQQSFPTNTLAVTYDGAFLAAGNDDGEVIIWRFYPEKVVSKTLEVAGKPSVTYTGSVPPFARISAGRLPICSLAFCQDRRRDALQSDAKQSWLLAIGDSGGGVTIWDLATQTLKSRCLGSEYSVSAVAFSPDGTLLVSGGHGLLRLWDTATGRELLTINSGDMFTAVMFSQTGSDFAVSSERHFSPGQISNWRLENGHGIRTFRGLAHQVARVCCSSNGQLLAALSHDWQVGLWNISSNALLHIFNVPRGVTTPDNAGLVFNYDASQFAFMAGTNAVLLDVKSGKKIWSWGLPPGRVEALTFDPSGRLLAFHFENRNILEAGNQEPRISRVWELPDHQPPNCLFELNEFTLDVRGAIWSPDASFIVIDGTGLNGNRTNHWVKAISPSGKRLWSHASRFPYRYSDLCVDAVNGLFAFQPGPGVYLTELRSPISDKPEQTFMFHPAAIHSKQKLIVKWDEAGGWNLHSMLDDSLLLAFQMSGTKSSHKPVFSRDGRLLVWGNQDGTVCACELTHLEERMNTLGSRWTR